MDKKEDLFSQPLLEYLNTIDNNGNADSGIPNYSVEKLEAAIKESQKRISRYVEEIGFDFDDEPQVRTFDDDFNEWENGEIIKAPVRTKKGLISEETKDKIREHLDKLVALVLAASIALSAGTVGLIYLKHKDDPKPWQVEDTNTEPVARYDPSKPNFAVTPTPVDKPVIPSSANIIIENNEDLTEEDSMDGRED